MSEVTRTEFLASVARQDSIDADLHAMRRNLEQIRLDTHELVETYRALSGGFKVLLWLGKIALAVTAIGGAIAVLRTWWFK